MGVVIKFFREGVEAGAIQFSTFSLRRQKGLYALDFCDCLTYDHAGEEVIGGLDQMVVVPQFVEQETEEQFLKRLAAEQRADEDLVTPWRPNWERSFIRTSLMLTYAQQLESSYDLKRLPQMLELVMQAQEEPESWTVSWHD